MRLNKAIEHLYLKVFVGIVVTNARNDVVVELVKGGELKERIDKSFNTNSFDQTMAEFIAPYLAQTPFYYIALLNPGEEQGALPSCSDKWAQQFTDISAAVTLCQDKKWMLYAAKSELDTAQHNYKEIGLDFIFSPFSVMKQFFHDQITADIALFVLTQDDTISIAVFMDGKLLFAEHRGMQESETLIHDDDTASKNVEFDTEIALDSINTYERLSEGFNQKVEEKRTFSLENFDKDFKRFQLIRNALHHCYNDPKYENQFIESVYVADGCGVGEDLKTYLEEELFLNVEIRPVELASEVVDLAKIEAKHAV